MPRIIRRLAVVVLLGCTPLASALVVVPTVQVGNLNNPNDMTTGYGAVAKAHSINKYEVINVQSAEFFNAADPADANTI